jgi:DNA repair exonuclease SbcCD ATPase subunit
MDVLIEELERISSLIPTDQLRSAMVQVREHSADIKDYKLWRAHNESEIRQLMLKTAIIDDISQRTFINVKAIDNLERSTQNLQAQLDSSNTSMNRLNRMLEEQIEDIKLRIKVIPDVEIALERLDQLKAAKGDLASFKSDVRDSYLTKMDFDRFMTDFLSTKDN